MEELYKTLLMVDDDQDDREIFQEALQELPLKVMFQEAIHGKDALEKLRNETIKTPDVIFLDLNMPFMGGMEFLETIKKEVQFAHIPVIIYTTSKDPIEVQEAYALNATMFITKPCSFKGMIQIIGETLEEIFSINK